jgi:hypothetical protein
VRYYPHAQELQNTTTLAKMFVWISTCFKFLTQQVAKANSVPATLKLGNDNSGKYNTVATPCTGFSFLQCLMHRIKKKGTPTKLQACAEVDKLCFPC